MKFSLLGYWVVIKSGPPPEPSYPENEASERWWAAFQFAGCMTAECLCGRHHFVTSKNAGDWEEGELESLLAMAAKRPDRYIGNGQDDSLSIANLPGGIYVWGCPCHYATRIENFLCAYRSEICDYFARQTEQAKVNFKRMQEEARKARGVDAEEEDIA